LYVNQTQTVIFEIARWDEIEKQYVPILNEVYSCDELKEAEDCAQQFNIEYEEELKIKKQNRKMIGNKKNQYPRKEFNQASST
jgi:hypothetical protein